MRFLFLINIWVFGFCSTFLCAEKKVELGVDVFFKENHHLALKNKKIGLIINHTSRNKELHSTVDLFVQHAHDYSVTALFAPEHGWHGKAYAFEKVSDGKD